ncbi:DUF4382 domain-containing protein [Ferroplasma sp.]|uniref:DUF4382 domain-containing protein n=1 Tax=Ferroplasma sp. TaxID=2591003 RepID=UPI00307D15B9
MKGLKVISIIVIVIIIGGIGFYGYHYETTGTMKVEVADTMPANMSANAPDAAGAYFNITIHSIGLYNSTSGWHNYTINKSVDIFGVLSSNASILGNLSIHAQSYSKVIINVTGASIYWNAIGITSSTTIHFDHPIDIIVQAVTIHAHASTTLVLDFHMTDLISSSSSLSGNVNANVIY